MKRVRLLLVLALTIPLLVLQFSCATVEKKEAEEVPVEKAVEKAVETPAEVEEAPEVGQLLADTHKTAGISCKECHVIMPFKNGVANDVCLTCHENYKEPTASAINPHDTHMVYESCAACHHSHKPSENQCLSCHDFDMQTP